MPKTHPERAFATCREPMMWDMRTCSGHVPRRSCGEALPFVTTRTNASVECRQGVSDPSASSFLAVFLCMISRYF